MFEEAIDDELEDRSRKSLKARCKIYMIYIHIIELCFHSLWQNMIIVNVYVTYSIQIYVIAFYSTFQGYFVTRIVLDIVYCVDTILSIVYLLTYELIKSNYIPKKKGYIALDIITLFSFDYLLDFGPRPRIHPLFIIMQILLFLRIYRLILYTVPRNRKSGGTSALSLIIKLGSVTFLIMHTLSCMWIYTCGFEHAPWTRGLIEKDIVIRTPIDTYTVAMYTISIYYCGTGYGDIVAVTKLERVIVSFAMIMGIFWIGIAVATLTSYHNDASQHHFEFSTHLRLIHQDLNENRNVSNWIREKIFDYYSNIWVLTNGTVFSRLFQTLPLNMRNAAITDRYWEALTKCTLLRDLDFAAKRALATKMRSEIYVNGDIIVRQGELRTRMMFVVRGIVKVLSSEDTESTIMLLGQGSLFCEIALMLCTPSPVQLEAGSFCELQILDRENVYLTAVVYRQISDLIFKTFMNLWDKALADEEIKKKESAVSKALGIKSVDVSEVKYTDDEYENPYTWLHEDEMVHLVSRPKIVQKTLDVYVPCKIASQTSDGLCARTKFPFVFQPGTSLLFVWDFVVVVSAILAAVLYPTRAAVGNENSYRITLLLINAIYVADFFISVMTATDHDGETLVRLGDIITFRLTNTRSLLMILCDILSFLPMYIFYKSNSQSVILLLHLNHVLKIWKLNRFVSIVESRYMVNLALIRSTACFLWITIVSFWMGSFYYLQACFGSTCRDASWYSNELVKDMEERDAFERHLNDIQLMLFLGVGFVGSVGFNEIHASTLTEMAYVIILSIISIFISSYFVASYNAILQLAKTSEMTFHELEFVIERFIENNTVLESLKPRIVRHLILQWQYRQGFFLNNSDLFYDTPSHLRTEIMVATRREELLRVPLLEGADSSLIDYIAKHAEFYILPPEEIVVYSGEPCHEFYVVEDGYCEKYSGISGELEYIVGPKGNFCATEMIFNIPATSEIRTTTHVKLLRVTNLLMQNALCHSPLSFHDINDLVDEFNEVQALRKINVRERKPHDIKPQIKEKHSWVLFSKNHEEYIGPFLNNWTQYIRYILLPRTLIPNGKVFKMWEKTRIVFIIISMLFFPSYAYMWLVSGYLSIVRYLLDFICLLDMYILMHVCYYTKEGILVSHPKATFINYLKHNFIIDFIVLFPMDIFSETIQVDEHFVRLQRVSYYAYFHKLLSGYRLRSSSEFSEIGEKKTSAKWFEDVLFFFYCIVGLNVLASIVVIISSDVIFNKDGTEYYIEYPRTCWAATKPFDHQSLVEFHLVALYWTACMGFAVAFGDITPLTSQDMIYCVLVFLLGYVLVTYMMVRITSRIAGFGVFYNNYKRDLQHMMEFLIEKKVSSTLQNEIFQHFVHVWSVTHSVDAQSILGKFHFALQQDAAYFLYEPTFKECEVFRTVDYFFFRQLGMIVQEEYYREGAIIFRKNDVISDVFFVHRGEVSLIGAGADTFMILRKGSAFGNIDDCANFRVSCTVKALKHLVLLKLDNRNLYSLLKDYPEIEDYIKEVALQSKIHLVSVASDEVDSSLQDATLNEEHASITPKAKKEKVVTKKEPIQIEKMSRKLQLNCMKVSRYIQKISSDLMVLFSTASLIITSYHAAFQDHSLPVFILEILLTLIYFIHLILRVTVWDTGEEVDGKTNSTAERLRFHVKTKQFWLDVFGFLPINLLSLIAPLPLVPEIWSYLNVTYIVRVCHIISYFNIKSKYQKLNEKSMKSNLMQLCIIPIVVLHTAACVLYVVDCFKNNCSSDRWAYTPISEEDEPNFICKSVYLCALYWAIEIYSCSGVGDIVPESILDVALMLIMVIFSKFVVCNLVGHVAAIVAENFVSEGSYTYEMPILRKYLKLCNLSAPLISHIESYAESLLYVQNGLQTPRFYDELPRYLKSSLMNEVFGYHIFGNVVFSGSHPDFLRQLVTYLKYTKYFAGNIIAQTGELNGTMYFIDHGEVEVLSVDGSEITLTDILKKGDVFGMIQGLYKSTPHTRTFRATAATGILSLHYDDWKSLLPFFPQTYKELYDRAYLFSFLP